MNGKGLYIPAQKRKSQAIDQEATIMILKTRKASERLAT